MDDILSILEVILNTGEAIAASKNVVNDYALLFDLEV
jgi:hypothetical protein